MKTLSLIATAGFAAAALIGCGGAPEELADTPGQETPATQETLTSQEQGARENGDWCFAWCNNGYIYAGPNVTQNCANWANTVCTHRGTTVYNAYWAPPYYYADYYL